MKRKFLSVCVDDFLKRLLHVKIQNSGEGCFQICSFATRNQILDPFLSDICFLFILMKFLAISNVYRRFSCICVRNTVSIFYPKIVEFSSFQRCLFGIRTAIFDFVSKFKIFIRFLNQNFYLSMRFISIFTILLLLFADNNKMILFKSNVLVCILSLMYFFFFYDFLFLRILNALL